MKSLALIVSETAILEQKLVESGGEITPEIESYLQIKDIELPEKVDSYSIVMDRFDALEKFYKERADFFSQIAKRCKGVRERLKDNLKREMRNLNMTEIKGNEMRFVLSKTKPALVLEDETLIPRDYIKQVYVESIDKDRLKEDLAFGPIPGAHLEESYSLRPYANTPSKSKKVKSENK